MNPSQRHLQNMLTLILALFGLVALSLAIWPVLRASAILTREDNPRLVEAELRIQRGTIFDQDGNVLAETIRTENGLDRIYPINSIGPAVGYYSFRHGTAGVEAGYDAALRGDATTPQEAFRQTLLHQPPQGDDIRLSLDARWQQVGEQLLGDTQGGLILLQLPADTAVPVQIISMVSHPTYDPNHLNERFDELVADATAPLLNRTTQGQYQPGMVLQPFIVATAVSQNALTLTTAAPDNAATAVAVNGDTLTCQTALPASPKWGDVLQSRCPAPLQQLVAQVGSDLLTQTFNNFGLTEQVALPLGLEPLTPAPLSDAALAAVGQDTLTVSPLQVARAWTALVTNGRLPTLQLITHERAPNGDWLPLLATNDGPKTAVAVTTAQIMQQALPHTTNGITEFSAGALSGPNDSSNGWYLGHLRHADSHYIVVLIGENEPDLANVSYIGRALLQAIRNN